MEQNEQNNGKKQVDNYRLAGFAFIGAGFAWLLAGINRALSVSLLALGIIFLALSKNNNQ